MHAHNTHMLTHSRKERMEFGIRHAISVPLSLLRTAHSCWPHLLTLATHGTMQVSPHLPYPLPPLPDYTRGRIPSPHHMMLTLPSPFLHLSLSLSLPPSSRKVLVLSMQVSMEPITTSSPTCITSLAVAMQPVWGRRRHDWLGRLLTNVCLFWTPFNSDWKQLPRNQGVGPLSHVTSCDTTVICNLYNHINNVHKTI